jgi:hypothetical protein
MDDPQLAARDMWHTLSDAMAQRSLRPVRRWCSMARSCRWTRRGRDWVSIRMKEFANG